MQNPIKPVVDQPAGQFGVDARTIARPPVIASRCFASEAVDQYHAEAIMHRLRHLSRLEDRPSLTQHRVAPCRRIIPPAQAASKVRQITYRIKDRGRHLGPAKQRRTIPGRCDVAPQADHEDTVAGLRYTMLFGVDEEVLALEGVETTRLREG